MKKYNQIVLRFFLLTLFYYCSISQVSGQEKTVENPFFSFNTGIKSSGFETFEQQAELLNKLGYDGVEKEGFKGFSAMQQAMKTKGLNIYTNYIRIDLDNTEQPYDPSLLEVFKLIEGKPTMI